MKENEIIRGTHNSMSYLPVKNWWMFPFIPVARCQGKDYREQFREGARVFDLRVCYNDKDGLWGFAHGMMRFKSPWVGNVINGLYTLAKQSGETVYVRLILERCENGLHASNFTMLCQRMEKMYGSHIRFVGGNRKSDWKKLYVFENDISDTLNNQWVGSMAEDASWIERLIPYLYARRHNKKNRERLKPILNLFDFI